MELRDLRLTLRRHWLFASVLFLACLSLGLVTAYLPPKTYRTSATVVVDARYAAGNPPSVVAFELPTIVETVGSNVFRSRVREALDEQFAEVGANLSATNTPGTGVLRVRAQGRNPQALAAWATAAAETIVGDYPPPEGDPTDEDGEVAAQPLVLKLLEEAGVPNSPVAPKPVPILFASGVLGLLAGLLGAVALHRTQRAFDVAEEIQRRLGLPIVGEIPLLSRFGSKVDNLRPMATGGMPELVEAFQSLRTNLDLAVSGGDNLAVAVTSVGVGEGKSTISAGLAIALAGVDGETLAVDADLRNPQLHVRLGVPFGEGLADAATAPPASLVVATPVRRLWFMAAGIPNRHPAELVPVALAQTKQMAKETGRRMVVDAPPILGVAETPTIVALAGQVLLVVDARKAKLRELEQVVDRLRTTNVTIVGVVLNRVRHRRRARSAYGAFVHPSDSRPAPVVEVPALRRPDEFPRARARAQGRR